MDKLRLGSVTGDVAARLRASLDVTGVSIKDFTKEAVERHLLAVTSRDTPRRTTSQDVSQDMITIVESPRIRITDDPEPSLEAVECPTCGTRCATCSDGLVPLNELADTILKELRAKSRFR